MPTPGIRRRPLRRGLSLVEALVSTTITAMAGSAILLAIGSSLQTGQVVLEQTIGAGVAQQILDEISGLRYAALGSGPTQWPLGPKSGEGPTRASMDDIDDFVGISSQPPADPYGIPLGQGQGDGELRHPAFQIPSGLLDNWRTEIDVYYVADDDLSTRLAPGQTSYHRAVEVQVYIDTPGAPSRRVAQLRRVFSYVPN